MRFTVIIKYTTLLLAAFLYVAGSSMAQTVELCIQNLSFSNGTICIAVFTSAKEFKTEKPFYELKIPKNENACETIKTTFSLPAGEYGISVLHDENLNGKMDYNIIGVPHEGFGFSAYYHRGLRKPSFDNFSFHLKKNENLKTVVIMKYF